MTNAEKMFCLSAKIMLLQASKTENTPELEKALAEFSEAKENLDNDFFDSRLSKDRLRKGFVKFTKKELLQMPERFRKIIRIDGYAVQAYKRTSGAKRTKKINYELRYRRDGYNIYASSNDLDKAKVKFIIKMHEAESGAAVKSPAVPSNFDGFAEYFFENFYKRKVKPETYRIALNQYKNHISPHFGNILLKRITPKQCQDLLDGLIASGKEKTADDVHSLLNLIFKAAVKHSVLNSNPLDMVFHTQHEREHGVALSKDEEKFLLDSTAETPFHLMFAVALYTGMRPSEYSTAWIDGDFIVAENEKRKNGKVEYKKIPITPMLRPYLAGITELKFFSLRVLRGKLAKILPNHKLYDLRTTFYTRCQECGVLEVAKKTFVGHSLGALANAYTDLSDEFLLSEGNKIFY